MLVCAAKYEDGKYGELELSSPLSFFCSCHRLNSPGRYGSSRSLLEGGFFFLLIIDFLSGSTLYV